MDDIPGILIVYIAGYFLGSDFLSAFVANERGRETLFWALAGLLTGPVALLALIGLPSLAQKR